MRELIHKRIVPKQTALDRAITRISPVRGLRRLRARTMIAMAESYTGASRTRRALSEWATSSGDADSDIIAYLPDLRTRSRDLSRNNALASGALNTKVTHVVGTGLTFQSRINREILGMTEEQATEWESHTEAEWQLWADNALNCDIEATSNFAGIQDLAFRSTLENGDVFILTPMSGPANPYKLKLQLIEADRVTNADNKSDYVDETGSLAGGVLRNKNGAPIEYHILEAHPGNIYAYRKTNKWKKVKAFGRKTGRRNIIHLYHKKRVGQSRGVPDLAPVIELIKQLGRYTDSEVTASVISSFFTVFFKSEYEGGLDVMEPQTQIGGKTSDTDYKMGAGAMLDLAPNEDITIANPTRPNSSFDPFVLAVTRQIGVALELPYELLIKHFTASYSAARAALLEAYHYFMGRRKWLTDSLCKPVYELFLTEAVATGRITAPGFLNGDPLIKAAYLGSQWTGPAKGQIDEKKEVEAAEKRVKLEISTLADEAAVIGKDWDRTHKQRVKEITAQRKDGTTMKLEGETDETVVQDRGEIEPNGSDLDL